MFPPAAKAPKHTFGIDGDGRFELVATLVIFTVAADTAAPLASQTVPLSDALMVCAERLLARATKARTRET